VDRAHPSRVPRGNGEVLKKTVGTREKSATEDGALNAHVDCSSVPSLRKYVEPKCERSDPQQEACGRTGKLRVRAGNEGPVKNGARGIEKWRTLPADDFSPPRQHQEERNHQHEKRCR